MLENIFKSNKLTTLGGPLPFCEFPLPAVPKPKFCGPGCLSIIWGGGPPIPGGPQLGGPIYTDKLSD